MNFSDILPCCDQMHHAAINTLCSAVTAMMWHITNFRNTTNFGYELVSNSANDFQNFTRASSSKIPKPLQYESTSISVSCDSPYVRNEDLTDDFSPQAGLLFWHTPLGMHSAICTKHQPPQSAVLSFVQCEVVGVHISLDGVQPCDTRTPWWSLPVHWRGSH